MKKLSVSSRVLFILFTTYSLFLTPNARSAIFSSKAKGTTTASFLKLPVNARAVALGEAYSAAADDASALYWNPAALKQIKTRSVTFMHALYIESTFFDYGAYAQPLGTGAIGIGVQYFSAGSLAETDNNGTDIGSFNPNDLAVSIGYAREVRNYSLGVAAKFIKSTLIGSAQTGALDFGVLSPAYLNNKLKLAFTLSNLGGTMKFDSESENLPLLLKFGSSYKINDRWRANADAGFPRDNDPYLALGTEYYMAINDSMSLAGRAGLNTRTLGNINGLTGFSLGLGFGYRKFGFDYGFIPFGDLGITHRFSVSWKF